MNCAKKYHQLKNWYIPDTIQKQGKITNQIEQPNKRQNITYRYIFYIIIQIEREKSIRNTEVLHPKKGPWGYLHVQQIAMKHKHSIRPKFFIS